MRGPHGQTVVFKTTVAADEETLIRQVKHALTLDLPELRDFEYPWADPIHLIGNGPSALNADLPALPKTMAVNGALGLFVDKGLRPTYWIGADPQPLLADFLVNTPPETTYLVASKAHPSVFEALAGRNVILWHMGDLATLHLVEDRFPVTPFHSVTTCAFEVLTRLGFRNFHTWGWDCSARDGVENAVAQDNGIGDTTQWFDVESRGRHFRTSGTWLHEAKDALSMLKGFPFPVTLHGPGFMGAYARDFLPMKVRVEE